MLSVVVTFRVKRRQGEMYIGHGRLSVAAFPHYCTDPDVTWWNGRGYCLVVHYWADLQSVHGFRCCDNTHICKLIALYTADTQCPRELVVALCLVVVVMIHCDLLIHDI